MRQTCKKISLLFAAGCLAAFIVSLLAWLSGLLEIPSHFHVKMTPTLTIEWLFMRTIWGGVFAWLFFLPMMERLYIIRGLVYSFIPMIIELFILMPVFKKEGLLGASLGEYAFAFVIIYSLIWGLITGIWYKITDE